MVLQKPTSLEKEHAEIHSKLEAIVNSKGRTALAAMKVAELLHAHFKKEEKIVIPPLGALEPYISGKLNEKDRKDVIKLTMSLKKEYKKMLKEHINILESLDELRKVAAQEKREDVLLFVNVLKNHALTEEEVLYPAALTLGELLKK